MGRGRSSLQVYCNYEAVTDEHGVETPILLCAKTNEDYNTESFYSPDCTEPFFKWLEELAIDQNGDDRNVIVIIHNLKGHDGIFLL